MSAIIFPPQNKNLVEGYANQSFYNDETLSNWLDRNSSKFANNPAIVSASGTLSYSDLSKKVLGLAAGLQSLGLGKGSVIAVQLPNIPEFILSYVAIASIGGIMQTLHMPYRESELGYLLNDSCAAAVICLSEFKQISPASTLSGMSRSLAHPVQVISLGVPAAGAVDFSDLINITNTSSETNILADDPFVLLYTSGTTSIPKGVPHRYNNFLTNARLCAEEYGFTSEDRLLSVAPMTHLYGLFTYNMTLSSAAASVMLPAFSPKDFVDTVKTQKPTAIFGAPAHFAACFQAKLLRQEDFESVNFVCLSGSTVQPELAQQVDTLLLNGKVGQLWGMSELQAGTITRLDDTETVRFNSGGRATPGTEIRVVDKHDQALPPHNEGELQVRGLSVFDGYINKAEETKKAFTEDNWFRTGDMAMLDELGNLKITGRTKNLINRGGVKYNPLEIEELLNNLPQVQQCAIIAVPDNVVGEKACVFIVVNEGKTITLEDIFTALNSADVAKYKWPEYLHIIASMPMTPTNKIKLEELRNHLNSI